MKQDIKERWVNALRSGEYTQGRGSLATIDRETGRTDYCCLGVLCSLAAADGIVVAEPHDSSALGLRLKFDGEANYLPMSVRNWAGLDSQAPKVPWNYDDYTIEEGAKRGLDDLNDSGRDFSEIADLIEEQL